MDYRGIISAWFDFLDSKKTFEKCTCIYHPKVNESEVGSYEFFDLLYI